MNGPQKGLISKGAHICPKAPLLACRASFLARARKSLCVSREFVFLSGHDFGKRNPEGQVGNECPKPCPESTTKTGEGPSDREKSMRAVRRVFATGNEDSATIGTSSSQQEYERSCLITPNI